MFDDIINTIILDINKSHKEAVKNRKSSIKNVKDADMYLLLIKKDPYLIKYIHNPSYELCEQAVKQNPDALKQIINNESKKSQTSKDTIRPLYCII